ncbi:hypothetical protein NEOLEDRAFT_1021766, partial [Neolentinus lepideus HHB14362 ss-1]
DDAYDENGPVIVDCDVLEAAKENIQPIAAGRRVTALSAILSTPHAQREARLASTKSRLRINVEVAMEDEDDDPLQAYCHFVYWTVENYPQGQSAESGLLELLEEATRVLKDDREGKWKSDIRYLKLWVLYASYIERPAIIYRFCLANGIGTEHELLYEEFALSLERSGRREEADKIYLLGIARQAQPLDRLKKKHNEFQKRMMVAAPVLEPPSSEPERRAEASTSRKALGVKVRPAFTTSEPKREDMPSSNTATSRPAPNARLQVFVDPTGELSESSTTNDFPDVGDRVTRVKENIPEMKKAAGTTLRQAGKSKRLASARSAAPRIAIAVYRDPEPEEDGTSDMPSPPAPTGKKGKTVAASSQSKGKTRAFTPFCDTDTDQPTSSRSAIKTDGFRPFCDADADGTEIAQTAKVASSFTPYRDEVSIPTSQSSSAEEPVIKIKKAGAKATVPVTEAEALRRDPFKNY